MLNIKIELKITFKVFTNYFLIEDVAQNLILSCNYNLQILIIWLVVLVRLYWNKD